MISCIICSRQSDISDELKENIKKTIGCEYELIIIDNSTNKHSIFSAYNKGVTLSKGDILCFMHEDIVYHTSNWGIEVIKYFEDYVNVGLIGVAGTHYLPNNPFAQWDSELSSSHLIQGSYVNGTYCVNEIIEDEFTKRPTQVVAVDGMWMCIKREIFNNINWDENIFSGFHAYDSDISLQILNIGKEVHIIWNILIEHKSIGHEDQKFYENSVLLYNKWKNNLPILKGVELSEKLIRLYDSLCYTKYMYRKSTYEYQKILISKTYKTGKIIFNNYNKIKKMLKNINTEGGGRYTSNNL